MLRHTLVSSRELFLFQDTALSSSFIEHLCASNYRTRLVTLSIHVLHNFSWSSTLLPSLPLRFPRPFLQAVAWSSGAHIQIPALLSSRPSHSFHSALSILPASADTFLLITVHQYHLQAFSLPPAPSMLPFPLNRGFPSRVLLSLPLHISTYLFTESSFLLSPRFSSFFS